MVLDRLLLYIFFSRIFFPFQFELFWMMLQQFSLTFVKQQYILCTFVFYLIENCSVVSVECSIGCVVLSYNPFIIHLLMFGSLVHINFYSSASIFALVNCIIIDSFIQIDMPLCLNKSFKFYVLYCYHARPMLSQKKNHKCWNVINLLQLCKWNQSLVPYSIRSYTFRTSFE